MGSFSFTFDGSGKGLVSKAETKIDMFVQGLSLSICYLVPRQAEPEETLREYIACFIIVQMLHVEGYIHEGASMAIVNGLRDTKFLRCLGKREAMSYQNSLRKHKNT